MVEPNDRRVDDKINMLKLSNRFILVPEGDLIQGRLLFLYGQKILRNQSHQVTRKGTYNLFFGSQQGGVSGIYDNIS